jgi:uroporphyrin-III C-methyltransferase/precorrin-2 dehydrogenase/sirohydrochlorin ferrochelatase
MQQLLPLFLDLTGRRVLLVGGGSVASAKLDQLVAAQADVHVVAPDVCKHIEEAGVRIEQRPFDPADLDDAWFVVTAATPDVNRQVAAAAESRRIFVNAVDDPANASAYLSGVVRRDGVTLAISTSGAAPALTGLLREGLDQVLPHDLRAWLEEARQQRLIWRRDHVPMKERRPLLLKALNDLYDRTADEPVNQSTVWLPASAGSSMRAASFRLKAEATRQEFPDSSAQRYKIEDSEARGHVSLVGAGPGDPGLLTRRAVARLRRADLVLYDALIDPKILKLARHAQRFFVGKRAGREAMSQRVINGVMIRAARRGKQVVRLKGGDPFVFGRGGEEVSALREAGISFEVVPGVTSAVAAPALAGIPLTHRGVSSAFLVLGGHDQDAFTQALGKVTPNVATLVILMGVGRRVALARELIARGWDGSTPSAIVLDASRPTQAVWRGTLEDIATERIDAEPEGAGTIVVGEVVALSAAAADNDRFQEPSATRAYQMKRDHYGSR